MSEKYTTRALARLFGIHTTYRDSSGVVREARRDVIETVARAVGGNDAPSDASAETMIARRRRSRATETLPAVVVAWNGSPPPVPFTLPASVRVSDVAVRIAREDGDAVEARVPIDDLSAIRRFDLDGVAYVRRALPLPATLPLGYHELTVDAGGDEAPTLILSAPVAAYDHRSRADGRERRWGVFAPVFSLHSKHSWGIGDYSDLDRLLRWTSDLGGDIVGTLPLLPMFLDEPFCSSPYSPVSRQFWNELFVDVARVPELASVPEARALVASDAFLDDLAAVRDADRLRYRDVMALKRRALEHMAEGFFASPSRRRDSFERYAATTPLETDYAAFRAAGDRHRTGFRRWPGAAPHGHLDEGDYDARAFRYHRYAQWLAHEQLSRVATRAKRDGLGLYLDYPIGVSNDGFDAWRHADLYTSGLHVGAPPDPLAPEGQDWGFPALVPDANRADHYRHLRAILRHHFAGAGVIRIDHVMGFHRLFVIPEGRPGADGVYLRYPHEEIYAIVCIESQRHQTVVLGEDLGIVPPAVREMMARHNVLRMHVFQGAFWDGADHAFAIPKMVAASMNTHDLSPFGAFWSGSDTTLWNHLDLIPDKRVEHEREQRAHLRRDIRNRLHLPPCDDASDAAAVLRAGQRFIAASDAEIQMIALEDQWLEESPLNVPGTTDEHPNWARRLRYSMEEVRADAATRADLTELDHLRRDPPASRVGDAEPVVTEAVTAGRAPSLDQVTLTDDDLHLFNEGTHTRLHEKFGAHVARDGDTDGVYFSVWAPNAERVSVIGSFNGWDPADAPLSPRGNAGVWEGFLPGVAVGATYKFHIIAGAHRFDKADPVAVFSEGAPSSASIVWPLDYEWHDEEWMAERGERNAPDRPISIYEVHLGSWRRGNDNRHLTYRELADVLVPYVRDLGYTHVELMPVQEHPFYGSWGYQITGYFAPTSRYGTPQDLMFLIDTFHQAEVGVLLDWVPSHFPTDGHGLAYFDGTHLYEHADPQKGFHPDWNSYIFNYGRHEIRSFLISNATYWLDRFHIDGLRVDAVASMIYLDYSRKEGEWIPNEYGGRENLEAIGFLKQMTHALGEEFPDTMQVAEESTAWPMVTGDIEHGGLGFAYKWDMGWMHDTLSYFELDPLFRSHHHDQLTFRAVYAMTERFVLSLSHDEVVHGKRSLLAKMPGDWWQQFATLRLLFGYMFALPGKKLHFMGGELAVWHEWNHDGALDWALEDQPMHQGMKRWVGALNRLYRSEASLHARDHHPEGFDWVDVGNALDSVLSFLRWPGGDGATMLVVCNFTPVVRTGFRVGVPYGGEWEIVLNSDEDTYGGSGVSPAAGVAAAEPISANGREMSLALDVPPLSAIFVRGGTPPPRDTA